jgi:hypothetical protein
MDGRMYGQANSKIVALVLSLISDGFSRIKCSSSPVQNYLINEAKYVV